MNLHLMHDDKFLDGFIKNIEAVDKPNNNVYVAYKSALAGKLAYIKSNEVILAPYKTGLFYDVIGDIKQYDKVFIHYLSFEMCEYILTLPCNIPIYWIFWGADLYSPIHYFSNLLFDHYSEKHFYNKGKKRYIPNVLLKPLLSIKNKRKINLKRKAIERVSYIMHFNEYDYKLIKSTYNTKAELLPFTYGSALSDVMEHNILKSDSLKAKEELKLGDNKIILLGNSGTHTNNHVSAINYIKEISNNENYKLICPLSYGDKDYIKYVILKGHEIIGDHFIPLTTFLSKKEYYQILQDVDTAIMNQNRTQAGGNIAILLFLGKKIFLPKENTLYRLYKDHGAIIYSIEDELNSSSLFEELSIEEKEKNKQLVKNLFSSEKAKQYLKKIVESNNKQQAIS